jgi:hypothetical protein
VGRLNPMRLSSIDVASLFNLFFYMSIGFLIWRPVKGCLNPKQVFSINTSSSHKNKNSSHEPTNVFRYSPPPLLHH